MEAVRDWRRPQIVTQMKSFMAFCSFEKDMAKKLAVVSKPLHRLNSKGVKFTWEEEQK